MRRTRIAAAAAALAAALVLTACGGSAPTGAAGAPAPAAGGTIKIGSLHPLTGSSAADGQQMQNGAQLAADAINADGGIAALGGAKLEIVSADTQGKPDVGQSEAQRLIQEGAVALIGTYQSAVTSTVATVAERNQVPLVIDVASADELTQQGYRNVFRIQPNATAMGTQGAQYLHDVSAAAGKPVQKVAYLHEQSAFGTTVKNAFVAQAQKLGFTVDPVISYDATSVSDLTTQVTTAKAAGADVLAVTGYYRDGVLAAQAVATVAPQINAVFGVADGAFDLPQFVTDAGAAGQGYFDANYHYDATKPETKALLDQYQQKFNEPIRTGAVLSYEAVRVIADSLQRAGKADPVALRDAIAATNLDSLMATNGPISFTDTGENRNATPLLMQVANGQTQQVFPQAAAVTAPIYPAPPTR
jgi:branched-chain amino acid transport system substrate-binding protein